MARRVQVSLRSFLIVCALAAVVFGLIGWEHKLRRERAFAIDRLRELGATGWGFGSYDTLPMSVELTPEARSVANEKYSVLRDVTRLELKGRKVDEEWLRQIETEYLAKVRVLELWELAATTELIGNLERLPNLEFLDIYESKLDEEARVALKELAISVRIMQRSVDNAWDVEELSNDSGTRPIGL